ARIKELTAAIYETVGHEFNINSPKQRGVILFEEMGIPCKKKTKSGYSTKAEILEELAPQYPVVSLILEFRSLSKLKSTYCDGLLKVINEDGRIHTSFNQVETRTGRISSLEPNLQNIPIRTELGKEMRKFFRAGEGNVLIDADYSQIELRVLADLADDENMIAAFNSGEDIHRTTAAQVFGLPAEMITPILRSRAKAVNFGIVYGIGAFSLAKDIGVSNKEAKEYIDGYLQHFSGVASYMNRMIEKAKDNGYSETLFKRRRYLPELASSNHMMRAFGERVARNMPIQGTAADIIKIAMVKVAARLEKENMKARLILQVHDELIVEAPESEAEKALEIVTEEMENACNMKVRLLADGKIGKTWYDAH
ncbi:MAG: DNA polymerase I, partial [Eubacterium sp.]|nr:DNA polymerase I [Eubacterium sp.]